MTIFLAFLYLAAGVAVAFFCRRRYGRRRGQPLWVLAGAALFWPPVAFLHLVLRLQGQSWWAPPR